MGYEKPTITEVGTVSDLTLGRRRRRRKPPVNHGVS